MANGARWDFVLCDGENRPLANLVRASGRQLKFSRNHFAEAQFVLSYDDPETGALFSAYKEGPLPTLRCYRKAPGAVTGTLRFNGTLAPFTGAAEETGLVTAMFRSPLGRLYGDGSSGTGRFTGAQTGTENQWADNIAADLIRLFGGAAAKEGLSGASKYFGTEWKYNATLAENPAGRTNFSYCGLAVGALAESFKVEGIVYPYANVGQAIINLSEALEGFDFWEDYVEEPGVEPTLARFNTSKSQGAPQPNAAFQYGPGTIANIAKLDTTYGAPCNVVRLLGGSGAVAEASEPASVTAYGEYVYEQSATDCSNEQLLLARAKALLRSAPVETFAVYPDLAAPNCPSPWDDFWLGDSVPLYARRGALEVASEPRVNEITVVVDDNGLETATIPDPYSATDMAPDLLHTVFQVQA